MDSSIEYTITPPGVSLADFVESFWMIKNTSETDYEIVVLPDGRVDLTFSQSDTEPFHIVLSGIETRATPKVIIKAKMVMFAISFKLPATEYILQNSISGILDYATYLPSGFWDFSADDLTDFDLFVRKAALKIQSLLPGNIDARKQKLFDLIYSSNGAITVKDLSEQVFWSSRQMNRYFNQQFGLSLKAYCNILRFRASFQHIKEGELFPQQDFVDQSHFIKEVKKLSGVTPKELKRNQNGRFIQLSVLAPR